MRQLPVDISEIETAMEMGSDWLEGEQWPYLDLETGQVIWVWEDDNAYAATMNADPVENEHNREAVESQPDRYVDIPDLESMDANDLLQDFLQSSWTTNEKLRRKASEAYHGSIGRWKKNIGRDPDILHAWKRYESQSVHRRALAFLAEHDIEPTEPNKT